jgi:hypothetical protein
MFNRFCFGALLLAGLTVTLTSCTVPNGLDAISISPNASLQLVVGNPATIQLTATGSFGNGSHPSSQDITDQVTWASAIPGVAVVGPCTPSVNNNCPTGGLAAGVVAAVGVGQTTISATGNGYKGPIIAYVEVTVVQGTSGNTGSDVISLSFIPSTQSVAVPGDTSQYRVIGTTSSGATLDLTANHSLVWASSSSSVGVFCTAATVPSAICTAADVGPGLVTGTGVGQSTISAIFTNTDQTSAPGTATFTVASGGGVSQTITSVSIVPASQSLAEGQQGNFVAIGTTSSGATLDLTSDPNLAWGSSVQTTAIVSTVGNPTGCNTATPPVCDPYGVVTARSAGSVSITAQYINTTTTPHTVVEATPASVSVSNTAAPEPLLSLQIIPNSITVGNLQDTAQFLAIGTFSTAPYVRDLTNSPSLTWTSDMQSVFPVNSNSGGNSGASAGIVTAYGNGSAVIIAEATSGGSIQTATAQFSCPLVLPNPNGNPPTPGTCYPGSQSVALLSTLTIYNEGLNNTNWQITAPSATGTANVIHCGPGWTGSGGSVCVATYPLDTKVVLAATQPTAPPGTGTFGGWSYNCTPSDASGNALTVPPYYTAAGPNYCTVVIGQPNPSYDPTQPISGTNPAWLNTNMTVGAIFN